MSKLNKINYLPGQTNDTPLELDSLRLFYSSLFIQKGFKSEMASKWLLKHGLLPLKLASKLNTMKIWDVKQLENFTPTLKPSCKFNFKPSKKVTTMNVIVKRFTKSFNFKQSKRIIETI